MTEKLTKEELQEKQKQLKEDIERLQKIIDASSETTFEIIIEDLKQQMIENVEQEHWSNVKSCIKEVDSVNGTKNFIIKQSELLNKKKEELDEVTSQIDHYQTSLFEQKPEEVSEGAEPTNISFNGSPLRTGDVYQSTEYVNCKGEEIYYAIVKSSEIEGKYAIISNSFREEMLLHYPKNLEILKNTNFIGNKFVEPENSNCTTVAKKVMNKIDEWRQANLQDNEEGEKDE